ncbi:hypothetical protein [Shimia sp.]|uniref:hypothetical protein n=1 Tax=Shimia sp. TaxID=1954381 RepID=UPI003BA9AC48
MPLLTEELMDLTLDELVNDYGCELTAVETWFGYEFHLEINGNYVVDAALPEQFAFDFEDLF